MKKIKENDITDVRGGARKRIPVCPDCQCPMTRTVFEFDDGEPGIVWLCNCSPTEEDLEDELEDELEDDDIDFRELEY